MATGYVSTAEYKGTVTASGIESITYTVVYVGTEIVPEPPQPTEPVKQGAPLSGGNAAAIGGTLLVIVLLAAHPDFVKLLADIQIYVEGIAAKKIQNLNALVDIAWAEIVEKYQPGENDRTPYLLQADKAPLRQIDRRSKTVAGPDCLEVGAAERGGVAEGEEAKISPF